MRVDQELRDWFALNQLMTRYAAACDNRDWDAFQAVFSDDAEIDYRRAFGRAGCVGEIAAWIPTVMSRETLPYTQHMIANLTVSVNGDDATGQCYYFNPDVLIENGVTGLFINGGQYQFRARKRGGAWLLVSLVAELFWSTRASLATLKDG